MFCTMQRAGQCLQPCTLHWVELWPSDNIYLPATSSPTLQVSWAEGRTVASLQKAVITGCNTIIRLLHFILAAPQADVVSRYHTTWWCGLYQRGRQCTCLVSKFRTRHLTSSKMFLVLPLTWPLHLLFVVRTWLVSLHLFSRHVFAFLFFLFFSHIPSPEFTLLTIYFFLYDVKTSATCVLPATVCSQHRMSDLLVSGANDEDAIFGRSCWKMDECYIQRKLPWTLGVKALLHFLPFHLAACSGMCTYASKSRLWVQG